MRHLFVSASSQSTVCRRQTFNEGQFAQLISQRRKPFDKKSISHDINPLLFITRQISPPNSLKYAASRLGAQISPVSHSLMATCETYAQHHPDDRAARAFPRGCRVGFWGQRRSYSPGDSSRRAGVCARARGQQQEGWGPRQGVLGTVGTAGMPAPSCCSYTTGVPAGSALRPWGEGAAGRSDLLGADTTGDKKERDKGR